MQTNKKMTNWRLLAHMATTICGLAASSALFSFAPSIVASYGYGRLRSNAMVSIGHWMVMLVTLAWGWISDTWGRRGPMVFIGISISWVFVVCTSKARHIAEISGWHSGRGY